jgi:hypothetical protein
MIDDLRYFSVEGLLKLDDQEIMNPNCQFIITGDKIEFEIFRKETLTFKLVCNNVFRTKKLTRGMPKNNPVRKSFEDDYEGIQNYNRFFFDVTIDDVVIIKDLVYKFTHGDNDLKLKQDFDLDCDIELLLEEIFNKLNNSIYNSEIAYNFKRNFKAIYHRLIPAKIEDGIHNTDWLQFNFK